MGEKKIVGLDGTAYIQDPDGQGWHPLEMPLSPDELAVQQFQEAVVKLKAELLEAFKPVVEAARNMIEALCDVWSNFQGSEACTYILAYCWACGHRPEWVRILNRTKKGRTRKKYQDRILRAYLESKEGKHEKKK